MKQYNKFSAFASIPALAAIISFAVSCASDIVVTNDDFAKYEAAEIPYGYIKNAVAPNQRRVELYQEDVVKQVETGITKPLLRAVDMNVTIEESVLAAYNKANNQHFEMLPADLVQIGQNGRAVVPPGAQKAEPLNITISPSPDLVQGTTYVIPLRISTDDPEVRLTSSQSEYLFYVIAQGKRMNAEKSAGYKVMSCMETGDADPRIHCELFLKNEGKPLVDMVVLFSANLNYNAASGKVYVHMNNSITPILQNRDRYLKPLQDMGIKVLLGLLGNWDPAGVAHLEYQTALDFVADLKAVVNGYGLDGFFWDDEYTAADPSIPGFSRASMENASRLIFEAKKAMPDKINSIFIWGALYGLNSVDGVQPGEYCDWYVANYNNGVNISNFPGSTIKQAMPGPYELNRRYPGYPQDVVSQGAGGIMVFALGDQRSNWNSYQLPALGNIAKIMFKDELEYTGGSYPVEW